MEKNVHVPLTCHDVVGLYTCGTYIYIYESYMVHIHVYTCVHIYYILNVIMYAYESWYMYVVHNTQYICGHMYIHVYYICGHILYMHTVYRYCTCILNIYNINQIESQTDHLHLHQHHSHRHQ